MTEFDRELEVDSASSYSGGGDVEDDEDDEDDGRAEGGLSVTEVDSKVPFKACSVSVTTEQGKVGSF